MSLWCPVQKLVVSWKKLGVTVRKTSKRAQLHLARLRLPFSERHDLTEGPTHPQLAAAHAYVALLDNVIEVGGHL